MSCGFVWTEEAGSVAGPATHECTYPASHDGDHLCWCGTPSPNTDAPHGVRCPKCGGQATPGVSPGTWHCGVCNLYWGPPITTT